MDEDQIADVLKSERLGHDEPGMRGVYGHVSPGDAGRTDDRAPSPLGGLATSARRAPASVRGATAEPATGQCPARNRSCPLPVGFGEKESVARDASALPLLGRSAEQVHLGPRVPQARSVHPAGYQCAWPDSG
jgi:hypothetical protein